MLLGNSTLRHLMPSFRRSFRNYCLYFCFKHIFPTFCQRKLNRAGTLTTFNSFTLRMYVCTKFFCLFIQFMRFSQQVYWGGLPFPPPADHVLSALPTITRPSWVVLHGMAHSFTELHKLLRHDKLVIHKVFLALINL